MPVNDTELRIKGIEALNRELGELGERLQRRDHRAAADSLQRERGEPAELLVFIAWRSNQLADGFRCALPALGQQPAEALAAVALRRRGDQDRLGGQLWSRRGAGGLCLGRRSRYDRRPEQRGLSGVRCGFCRKSKCGSRGGSRNSAEPRARAATA